MQKRTISRVQEDNHKPKELRRLYEPLGVLYELNMKDPTKPRSIFSTKAEGINITQRRRDFVDALAFLGAYRKGCEIAVAVEQQPDQLIVRVAGTGDIDGTVVPFLNSLLKVLSATVKIPTDEFKGEIKDRTFVHLSEIALDHAQEKAFAHYMKLLHHIAPICLANMTSGVNGTTKKEIQCLAFAHVESTDGSIEPHEDSNVFKNWFQENFYKNGAPLTEKDMKLLAKDCFKARQSKLFDLLRQFTHQGHECATYFEKFYEQLRKLSLTIDMTSQLLESAISLCQDLANDLVAESIPSAPDLPIPLLPKKLTEEGIANRMFSDASRRDDFIRNLQQTAPPGLAQTLAHYSQTVLTQVHPELLVINHFDSLSNGGFIDERDKYIACTKPSCYLCHLFISYHPGRYSMISSSSRLCLNWRLPDISRQEYNAMSRAENQKIILGKLTNTIRNQLEEKVKNDWIQQPQYTESETEGTSHMDDDTVDNSFQSPSRESTPNSQPTLELATSSDEMSDVGKGTYRDTEDVVVFKGRYRF